MHERQLKNNNFILFILFSILYSIDIHTEQYTCTYAFFEFFGHPRKLTLEQGEFLLLRRLEELEFALSETDMSHVM